MKFIKLDTDASAENMAGEISVHQASRSQCSSLERGVGVTTLLLERGTDIDVQDESHVPWSHIQSSFGPVQMAQALFDHGANVNSGPNGRECKTSLRPTLEGKHHIVSLSDKTLTRT